MALTNLSQITTSGIATGTDLNIRNITGVAATFTGNVTVGGTLTYDDVTNIDSVGLITARSGINVTSGDVNLTSGNLALASATPMVVASNGSGSLRLGAGGSEKVRITSGGLVGIGTITPGSALEIRTTTTNAATHYRNNASNGGAYFGVRATDLGAASAGEAYIYSYNSGINLLADGTGHIDFATGGTASKVRITSGGFVGINNTSPELQSSSARNLVIGTPGSGGQNGLTICSNTSGTNNIYFGDASSGTGESTGRIVYSHADDSLTFHTVAQERLRITSTGNIGIGTVNVVAKVDVVTGTGNGTANEANCLRLRNRAINGNAMTLQVGVNTAAAGALNQGYSYLQGMFWGGGANPILLNPKGGNVGIGRTSAHVPLDVNGDTILRAAGQTTQGDLTRKYGFSGTVGTQNPHSYIAGVTDKTHWYQGFGLVFGTVSGNDISNTLGVERMRISSDGLVGIGTNVLAPSSKLTLFEESGNGQTLEIIAKNAGGVGSQPGIKFTANNGDNIGGIYGDVNSDSLRIQTGGTERLQISNSGNVTASTENSVMGVDDSNAIRVGLFKKSGLYPGIAAANNAPIVFYHSDAANIASPASQTYTERLRIDSDGRLIARGATASNAWAGGDDLIIGNTNSGTRTGITLVSHSGSDGGLYWSDGTGANVYRGQFVYNHASDTMTFYTASSSKLTIDTNGHMRLSSGDLRVGDNTDSNAGSQTISVGSVSSGSGGIGIFANPTNGNSFVQFGDGTSSADQYRGYMNYRHADDSLRFGTANTDRLLIASAGGHKIVCDESWHAANLSECNTEKLALNINKTRQGQTKGIAIGCVGSGSGATGIQAYDTSNNSANTLEINPFGGNLLYGDTASDLSSDHKFIAVGAKHAFQYDGNAGTYLSVILGAANGTVDLEADARSGGYPDLRFITTNDEQLRVLAAGHVWKKNDGALWHGTLDINDFSNAGRSNYNKVSIRAGSPNAGTSPTNDNSAIKIYPVGSRSTTTGNLTGGIAWQHLDPSNGDWDTYYGAGAQMWMGAAFHDNPGQERDRFNLWMNSQTTGNTNPNNLAIEAYPNGMVRHPKVPAFMVRSTNNTSAFTGNARANWTTVILDNGSNFSTSNDVFTAPIDGIYYFSCMMLSNAGTRLFHEFRVNGTRVDGTRSEGHAVSNSYQTNTITMVYSLSASDYVEVWVSPNNAYGGTYSNFNGFLVG